MIKSTHSSCSTKRAFVCRTWPTLTPAILLDIELPAGGSVTTHVPPEFQGFAYVLEGQAAFGANQRRARPAQLVLLGRGEAFTVTDAAPATRYLLMAGQPYGETPRFNGPYVD